MGNISHTVGGDSNLVSFRSAARVPITSLKAEFLPVQEGEGDPSPDNIRPISGWNSCSIYTGGKNIGHIIGYSATTVASATGKRILENTARGFSISTIDYNLPDTSVTITCTDPENGYLCVLVDNLIFDQYYTVSFRVSNITANLNNLTLDQIKLLSPRGNVGTLLSNNNSKLTFRCQFTRAQSTPNAVNWRIIANGLSYTLSEFMVMPDGIIDDTFEPYNGQTIPITFPVLGKNKFNWNVEQSYSSPVGSDLNTLRSFTPNTYVIGMSVNNYYRYDYTTRVLNPSVSNGIISFSSGGASGYGIAFPLELIPGQTYFLSGTGNGSAGATYYDKDGKVISFQNARLNKTITVPQEAVLTLIGFYASATNTDYSFSNIQLELGTGATSYEEYNSNNTVYGGYVDIAKGEVVQTWKIVDLGNYNWSYSSNTSPAYFSYQFSDRKLGAFSLYCSSLFLSDKTSPNNLKDNSFIGSTINGFVFIRNDSITSAKDFISSMAGVKLAYELNEPIHYPLSKTELKTFLDQNNIWSNTNGNTEISYAIHDSNMIQSARKAIAGNEPHFETVSGTIANFNTDMAVPLKEAKIYFEPVQDLHGYDEVWPGGYGKNLFNINVLEQNPDDTTASNTTIRNITPGTYFVGASWSNWLQANQIIEFSISNETLSIKNNNVYGIGFAFKLIAETTYAISATTTKGGIHAAFYDIDGNYISGTSTSILNSTFTTPTNANITVLVFFNRTQGADTEPATFSNIQLEKGSSVTSYVPYENICPIEGWDNIEVYKTGKNLFQFKNDNFSITAYYYNGYSGWMNEIDSSKIPHVPLTYSVNLDMRDSTSEYLNNVQTWLWKKRGGYNIIPGNSFASGQVGRSISHMTINDDIEWAGFGLSVRKGGLASNPMIEVGSEATEYEPYNGITIPFMFSVTKNLFNEKFTGIISTLTYHSYYVGNDTITASTTTPKSTEGWSNIFVLSGIVTSGANTTVNDICEGQTRTITPTNGYITIAYRNGYGVDPRNYQTQIEKGLTATSYEPYKPIYGGYIDLVTGEIYSKYHKLNLANLSWYNYSRHQSHYTTINRPANGLIFSNILTPKVNTIWPGQGGIGYYTQNKYRNYIYVQKKEAVASDAEFRTWFAEMHPDAYIVYELAVPELITTLSPTQLKTLRGQNNIWSNANGNIEVKYWTH